MFTLRSDYPPAGDQPTAIDRLTAGLNKGKPHQILLGVTGSGKTFTMANVIARVNRPTLVIAHNKTLAAQLCAEFREVFPQNAVEYFISYYDYYQPEAYLAARDVYIEKESETNEEIERLRHSATRSLLTRRDVIIVASVSCIYGLGSPEEYTRGVITLKRGQKLRRDDLLIQLQRVQYERNDVEVKRGNFRVKGDVVDIFGVWDERLTRIDFFGDEIEHIQSVHPVSGNVTTEHDTFMIFPATHYVVGDQLSPAIRSIESELAQRLDELRRAGKELEARRLEQRTRYDLEMIREIGFCKGIENYSRHLSGREPGSAPDVLINFFPKDFLTIIDESHTTIPQIKGMFRGDQARKQALVDYGFRLPSAFDNRPLNFEEFWDRVGQTVFVSATPGDYELGLCRGTVGVLRPEKVKDSDIVEQIIRPTGLLDPIVEVRKTAGQMDDLIAEVHDRVGRNERVLVTTVTKRFSEDVADFLADKGVKVRYLHSEIETLDRIDILHDLRAGIFDVLVGVNLLREGLDLPEVSLVAILDADKEGFLRNERSLIQTMGRAARNQNGMVILYADKTTQSMRRAIDETQRRRSLQMDFNRAHDITPRTVIKKISDIRDEDRRELKVAQEQLKNARPEKLPQLLGVLEKRMKDAADNLEFELAAVYRDQIEQLKNQ
jgi:excinuclease ABC subunit B